MSQALPPFSPDGLYRWDGEAWVSTISPDGRYRWNGTAWVQLDQASRVGRSTLEPSPRTRPLQAMVAAFFTLEGLFSATLPFWFISTMTHYADTMNRRFGTPPPSPAEAAQLSAMNDQATVAFYVLVGFSLLIAIGAVVAAIRRWMWSYPLIILVLVLEAIFFFMTAANSLLPSLLQPGAPPPAPVLVPAATFLVLGSGLAVWMVLVQARGGPWGIRPPAA